MKLSKRGFSLLLTPEEQTNKQIFLKCEAQEVLHSKKISSHKPIALRKHKLIKLHLRSMRKTLREGADFYFALGI